MTRKSVLDMWAEANERTELVPPQKLADEIESGEVLLLDARNSQTMTSSCWGRHGRSAGDLNPTRSRYVRSNGAGGRRATGQPEVGEPSRPRP